MGRRMDDWFLTMKGRVMARNGYSNGRNGTFGGTTGSGKGPMPAVPRTKAPVIAQATKLPMIEHTYEESPAVRRGQGLSTNANIGCGYGAVTGKGKAD